MHKKHEFDFRYNEGMRVRNKGWHQTYTKFWMTERLNIIIIIYANIKWNNL